MPTLSVLSARFTSEAQVVSEENITDPTIQQWISDAISAHNSSYNIDGSDLPGREIPLVFLLAKITLATARAEAAVNQGNLHGTQGYGQDRSTPFANNLKLITALQDQYSARCASMGITPNASDGSTQIVQGTLSRVDYDYGVRTPYRNDVTPLTPVTLVLVNQTDSECVLKWNESSDAVFDSYLIIVYETTTDTIYDVSNFTSDTGVPRINDNALLIGTLYQRQRVSVKVQNLFTSTYRFMVVARNRNRRYVYSNELSVSMTSTADRLLANDDTPFTADDDTDFTVNT